MKSTEIRKTFYYNCCFNSAMLYSLKNLNTSTGHKLKDIFFSHLTAFSRACVRTMCVSALLEMTFTTDLRPLKIISLVLTFVVVLLILFVRRTDGRMHLEIQARCLWLNLLFSTLRTRSNKKNILISLLMQSYYMFLSFRN